MLTRRQKQILVLLTQGLSNKEIAFILRISENTVKMHLRIMYMRLGVPSRGKLVAKLQQPQPQPQPQDAEKLLLATSRRN
jgi:DNA-binding CsgD family transcriptional regulator